MEQKGVELQHKQSRCGYTVLQDVTWQRSGQHVTTLTVCVCVNLRRTLVAFSLARLCFSRGV